MVPFSGLEPPTHALRKCKELAFINWLVDFVHNIVHIS